MANGKALTLGSTQFEWIRNQLWKLMSPQEGRIPKVHFRWCHGGNGWGTRDEIRNHAEREQENPSQGEYKPNPESVIRYFNAFSVDYDQEVMPTVVFLT